MSGMLHEIPWEVPATLAAAAALLALLTRAVRALRAARLAGRPRRAWLRTLRTVIVVLGALLAPVFFADMFRTVTDLLGPSFGAWSWTVPAATEGSFVFLYLLDLYLLAMGKPMGWLRYAPYPFAAASLFLNIYSSFGDLPGLLGHGVVTVAFFLPLLAGEAAVKSLSVSDETVALARETRAARQYAIDLVRDQKGILWRWRIPSLLRSRILHARFPADVMAAVKDGAAFGGGVKWEQAVERMVAAGLTQRARMTASVAREERSIRRQDTAADPAENSAQHTARDTAGNGAQKTAGNTAQHTRRPAPENKVRKPTRAEARKMSPEQLAAYVGAMLEEHGSVSQVMVMDELHIGFGKARDALTLAKSRRVVVPIAKH